MRFFKFPKWQKWFYPDAIWDFFSVQEKTIYLTFDDGPNQETTTWLLELLKQEGIKATFFWKSGLRISRLNKTNFVRRPSNGYTWNVSSGWIFLFK